MAEPRLDLFDPRTGGLALSIEAISTAAPVGERRRFNGFTVILAQEGSGAFLSDLARFPFEAPCLLFAVPYQTYGLIADTAVVGDVIQFHANFFCIETYHEEVGCNGVLFNDVYGVPVVSLDRSHTAEFRALVDALRREIRECGLAHSEVLVSYLKILLVRATRLKLEQQTLDWQAPDKRPPILDELRTLIEANFTTLHQPSDYAQRLHITPKALAKLVKTHLHKTLTELIRERIMRQAKWELLHTEKPVKQVARQLGFDDVFYFSRLFKRSTGCSPTFFREYETAIRGGRNLSMPLRPPSIPDAPTAGKNGVNPALDA